MKFDDEPDPRGSQALETSQNSQENNCARVSFLIQLQAWETVGTLAQVFFCEFCEISKNTFFDRTLLVAASVFWENRSKYVILGWEETLIFRIHEASMKRYFLLKYKFQNQSPRRYFVKRCY